LAPFDPTKSLKKLKSWDALPSEAEDEAEEIKPLLTRILDLKNAAKKELSGTQLMVFFLQRRISTTASLNFQAMDLFECNRPFSSLSEGSSDQGSREKGSIDDKFNH
jgi:hypothetical protein